MVGRALLTLPPTLAVPYPSQGQLKEFDEPTRLLSRKESMFNKLVDDTGPHASGMLRRMAAEGPKDDRDDEEAEA